MCQKGRPHTIWPKFKNIARQTIFAFSAIRMCQKTFRVKPFLLFQPAACTKNIAREAIFAFSESFVHSQPAECVKKDTPTQLGQNSKLRKDFMIDLSRNRSLNYQGAEA